MKGSKREQRRLEAAEEVCRAFRKALSYYGTQAQYMNVALDWLLVWIANAPKSVSESDPTPRNRRNSVKFRRNSENYKNSGAET